jgi:ubiquitin C-terminal hydrolase
MIALMVKLPDSLLVCITGPISNDFPVRRYCFKDCYNYEFKSKIIHEGSKYFGHYYAIRKYNDKNYIFNDSHVKVEYHLYNRKEKIALF